MLLCVALCWCAQYVAYGKINEHRSHHIHTHTILSRAARDISLHSNEWKIPPYYIVVEWNIFDSMYAHRDDHHHANIIDIITTQSLPVGGYD